MTTATLTISERYETGRSDGYADGSHCAQWTPQLVHDELATFPDRLRIAREQRQACAYFSGKYPERWYATRAFQAYAVGFARGFREAVQDYARGRVARVRFDSQEYRPRPGTLTDLERSVPNPNGGMEATEAVQDYREERKL